MYLIAVMYDMFTWSIKMLGMSDQKENLLFGCNPLKPKPA
jgi:hypothetical protein